jgi:threonine/homoserine/homoserine lactone efflux protein
LTPGTWLSVALVCALGAVSPGPSLAVVVRHALGGSRAHGVTCALAHACGVGLYALATAAGLAAVLVAQPALYRVLAAAGALYLAWLGLGALRATGAAFEAMEPATGGLTGAARDGFAMALLNPKIAVFFLALFSQFVTPDAGAREMALLTLIAFGIDGAWYMAVAIGLTGERVLGRLRGQAWRIERATGIVLLGLAAWTLFRLAAGP